MIIGLDVNDTTREFCENRRDLCLMEYKWAYVSIVDANFLGEHMKILLDFNAKVV